MLLFLPFPPRGLRANPGLLSAKTTHTLSPAAAWQRRIISRGPEGRGGGCTNTASRSFSPKRKGRMTVHRSPQHSVSLTLPVLLLSTYVHVRTYHVLVPREEEEEEEGGGERSRYRFRSKTRACSSHRLRRRRGSAHFPPSSIPKLLTGVHHVRKVSQLSFLTSPFLIPSHLLNPSPSPPPPKKR